MINLQVIRPRWIKDQGDDPEDQCAHGQVELVVNGEVFLDASNEQGYTLNAAALFLLRTIERDHVQENPVSPENHLFPCCGFNAWPVGENGEIVIPGCNSGTDVWVRHVDDFVMELRLDNRVALVRRDEWTRAVVHFAEQVKDFYARSLPKVVIKDDLDWQGWQILWGEYECLMEKHRVA